MLRKIALLSLFVLAVYLLADSRAVAANLTRSNFASSITSESMAAVWIAKDRGLFRKYGLDPQFIQMPRSALTVAALIAGEIDMAVIGPGHLINAATSGADLIGIANFVQKLDYRLVGKPELKRPEDLRGKRIAISGTGAVSHIVALLALQKLSFDPNQGKITFLAIPGTELNRRIALETGSVDATALNGSIGDLYAGRGYSMLFNFKGSGVTMPQTMLVTTRRTAANKPQLVEAYLKTLIEATAYLLKPQNKDTVTRIMASNLRLNSVADAEEAYQAVTNSHERVPYPNLDGMKKLHGVLSSINPKLVDVRVETVVDPGFLSKLESSGFIQSVYRKP